MATLLPIAPGAASTPIDLPEAPPKVIVEGTGGGHGVGMSQYGAYGMSRAGKTASQIIQHYYSGAAVTDRGPDSRRVRVGLGTNYTEVPFAVETGKTAKWKQCDSSSCWSYSPPAGDTSVDASWFAEGVSKLALYHGDANAVVTAPHPSGKDRRYRYGYLVFRLRDGKIDLVSVQPDLEVYLRGLAEVPSYWGASSNEGMAALEAQAITGRTYALKRLGSISSTCDCHLSATPAHQYWVGYDKETEPGGQYWVQAVESTEELVATYGGAAINTYYSASHGGRSENIEDSWAYGTSPSAYLKSVSDGAARDPSIKNPYASTWTRTTSNSKFAALLGKDWKNVARIRVIDRTDGGTPRTLRIEAIDGSGARRAFDWGGPNKSIAGASLRHNGVANVTVWSGTTVGAYPGSTLPSSQVSRIGLAPFRDDDGSAHEYSIARIAAAGVTVGCDVDHPDRFCPGESLTRAQMATFLVRSFKDLDPVPNETRFKDTRIGAIHTDTITAIADAGITKGCGDGNYCPSRDLTRAEMATLLVRAIDGLAPVPGETRFSDVKVGATHADAITAIADAGITLGCGGDKFCPDRPVTRGEMASFLVRALTWRP